MTGVSLTYLWFFYFFLIILTENYIYYFFKLNKNKKLYFTTSSQTANNLQNTAYGQYCIIVLLALSITLKVNKL